MLIGKFRKSKTSSSLKTILGLTIEYEDAVMQESYKIWDRLLGNLAIIDLYYKLARPIWIFLI